MATSQFSESYLVAIHLATTGDEHQLYVPRNTAEIIELAWCIIEASTFTELYRNTVLIRPISTPITDLCTSSTQLTWTDVQHAGSLAEAIDKFTGTIQQWIKEDLFSFVVLDGSDLRVQLNREARDKNITLPACLQYPRLYDLQQECLKRQDVHLKDQHFGPSVLLDICSALGIPITASARPKASNLPQFAANQALKALDICTTMIAVVRELVKSSTADRPFFNSVHDTKADIDAFLQEQSKILHLAGLAQDTTQSELESWFTQYGGRPIAFWTLRTPDQAKSLGIGYAVFSTHVEARDSLHLNGRAINDHTIQVSPSSSRVLDRAAQILVPFPPSKNRPRPGDWICPSCGFSNFERRTACFRCAYPPAQPSHRPNYYQPSAPRHAYRVGDWTCATCSFHNFARNFQCLKCGSQKE